MYAIGRKVAARRSVALVRLVRLEHGSMTLAVPFEVPCSASTQILLRNLAIILRCFDDLST